MIGFSYYDGLYNILKNEKENKELQKKLSNMTFSRGQYIEDPESCHEQYSSYQIYQKLKTDMPKLERFIKDKEYRKQLQNSYYRSRDLELFVMYGLEKMVKKRLGIPENATIKYDKVKCSKYCTHHHRYFYAYYWDPTTKRLKKKYIGKRLPEPFKFTIAYSIE